ncbi:MAG: hypothetical protein ASARMPRED_002888 [Alectoria sarmentosa]|nr:MAG: hypothetical protein ASARMPRED_002888 [Alectoria sarmentosa]
MGLGISISRNLSVTGSSNYDPSHRNGSASTRSTPRSALRSASSVYESSPRTSSASTVWPSSSGPTTHLLRPGLSRASTSTFVNSPVHPSNIASRTSRASTVRASTVTSATYTSKLIRSASTSRESTPASMTSTLRPPTVASSTSKASVVRASTVTSATSTSKLIRSASNASTARSQTSGPATSNTNLLRSVSKRAPSYFSTTASRFLWGRPPPGHSTLQPSQIAALTHTLSLPVGTPMLCSVVGALSIPLSRSQFSPVPRCFCNDHFWLEQKYIDELTEAVAYEIGPQLDKLRMAPRELISKKTERLLSILQPYKDIFIPINETSSIVSVKPTCPACTLSHFFQNPKAVKALTICVKGRKHRAHPWPASVAWLDPCPGKGVDWEAKWKTEGKSIGHDRVRVQRWRRENRVHEETPEEPQAPGHQPGEGCDFCDALRMEQAEEAELDAAIAEEDERAAVNGSYDGGAQTETDDDDDDDGSATLRDSDSETLNAMKEESIIDAYEPSTMSSSTTAIDSVYHHHPGPEDDIWAKGESRKQSVMSHLAHMGETEDAEEGKERATRASDWARSYRHLVGRQPETQTTLLFERYPEPDPSGPELWAVEGWI